MIDKARLRQAVLQQVKSQDREEKARADEKLLELFLSSPSYQTAKRMATFLSFSHEFSTEKLIEQALVDGKEVYVPKTYSKGKMEFVEYRRDSLQKTSFGLLEPVAGKVIAKSELDLIHVPGLLFTPQGYRLGYGGGYYDRYLADFAGNTVSTIYDWQLGNFQHDWYDIAVKEILIDETSI